MWWNNIKDYNWSDLSSDLSSSDSDWSSGGMMMFPLPNMQPQETLLPIELYQFLLQQHNNKNKNKSVVTATTPTPRLPAPTPTPAPTPAPAVDYRRYPELSRNWNQLGRILIRYIRLSKAAHQETGDVNHLDNEHHALDILRKGQEVMRNHPDENIEFNTDSWREYERLDQAFQTQITKWRRNVTELEREIGDVSNRITNLVRGIEELMP